MSTITTAEITANPQAFISRLEAGETLAVKNGEHLLAEVTPAAKPLLQDRPFGLCKGMFKLPNEFDAPLPEEILRDWEGCVE